MSYFVEFSQNLTTFATEYIFVDYPMKERGGGKQNNSISCSYLGYCNC